MSAVFVWSRGITFIPITKLGKGSHTHESSRLVPSPFKNGNVASRLFVNLKFQKLSVYLCMLSLLLPTWFACSRSIARSVHLLYNAIVNNSWLACDHTGHMIGTWYAHEKVCKCDQAPFLIFRQGLGTSHYSSPHSLQPASYQRDKWTCRHWPVTHSLPWSWPNISMSFSAKNSPSFS